MIKLAALSVGFDVPSIQPYLITVSEDGHWSVSAVSFLCLYSLSMAHLCWKVVVDLLNGGGCGQGIGVSWY